MRARIIVVLTLALHLLSGRAEASGPGVHMLESDLLLDLLVAEDTEWEELATTDLARSYVHLGAVAPDIQWAVDELRFGHSRSLAYALLDAGAGGSAHHLLFALGFLAHQTTDGSGEMFVAPTLVSQAALGILDVDGVDDGPEGEVEGLFEGLGDLIVGDWDMVVDVVYDFWLDGPEAQSRGLEIMGWYCEAAAAAGQTVDCDLMLVQLQDVLALVEEYLGHMDREQARDFVHGMFDRQPAALMPVWASGMVSGITGAAPGTVDPVELDRLETGPVATEEFWAAYDTLKWLGPTWAAELLETRVGGWPSWTPEALVCGNLLATMQAMPERYDVEPGFLVDDVGYEDGDGNPVSTVSAAQDSETLFAKVRFYSAYHLATTVTGIVRRDRPGLDPSGDDVVGTAQVDVDIDPLDYAGVARTELEIPFVADTEDALGFYVELHLEPNSGASFTTSWDALWRIPHLDLDRAVYRNNFGTYGHWPPSLPVGEPVVSVGTVMAKARVAPEGPGIPGAELVLTWAPEEPGDGVWTGEAGTNGISVFDLVAPGIYTLDATAPGYLTGGAVTVTVAPRQQVWSRVALHAVPAPLLGGPAWPDRSCFEVSWDAAPFGGQVAAFLAQLADGETDEPLGEEQDLGRSGPDEICLDGPREDGSKVAVVLRARYKDETFGVEGRSAAITVDGSAPEVVVLETRLAEGVPECVGEAALPYRPAVDVDIRVTEPHSALVELAVSLGGETWEPVTVTGETVGEQVYTFSVAEGAGGDEVLVRARNAAGLETMSAPAERPVWGVEHICAVVAEPGPDTSGDAAVADEDAREPGTDATSPDTVSPGPDGAGADAGSKKGASGGGGCSGGAGPRGDSPAGVAFLLALVALAWARRARPRLG